MQAAKASPRTLRPSTAPATDPHAEIQAILHEESRFSELEDAQLWQLYQTDPSEDLRNFFLRKYKMLVRFNADRIYARLPDEVDLDDLIQAGTFGLMDAIRSFDPEKGVKFETFSATRIRGAILDELRAMDWVPRLVRSRTSKVDQVRQSIQMELGRKATEEEISERLGVNDDELKKILRDSSAVSMTSIDKERYRSDGSREVREIDVLHDQRQANPLSEVQRRDLKNLLTKGLSRAERLIVILYYYEDMTMKEIGQTLDLSESRVSQMHSSILARLKSHMQHREKEFEPTAEA
jgi:RNA polymerase sigma factor for flagellar operon FliA